MASDLTSAEFAILSLLGEGPRHGYELETLIVERGLREWTEIGFSSIYFLLGRLEKAGLAEPLPGPRSGKARRPFAITEEGRVRLVEQARRMIAAPNRVFPQILLGMANWPALARPEGIDALDERALALQAEAARLAAARDRQQPLPHFVDALFDYAIGQISADLDWIKRTRERLEPATDKMDFRKSLKQLYQPPVAEFVAVEVPTMQFVKVDGVGDPNTSKDYKTAVEWLYSVSYAMKFAAKATLGKDYVVPPLEGLWWSDDPSTFVKRQKDRWRWTMMIMTPDFVDRPMFETAVAKAGRKLGATPASLRLEAYDEGPSLQTMHVGSYDDEGPVLARLHEEVMPARSLTFNGPHHEIYLGDPRRTKPEALKTVLRQPVRPA